MLCSPLGAYFTAHRSTCIAFSSNFLTSLYHMSLQKQHSALRKYTYIIHFQSLDFQYTMGSKKSETTSENAFFFSITHYIIRKNIRNKNLNWKNQQENEKMFVLMTPAILRATWWSCSQAWFEYDSRIILSFRIPDSLMTQIYLISDLETVFFHFPHHSVFLFCFKVF